MEIATKPAMEVNSRVHEPLGLKSERVGPETSNETRTARTIPPPLF